MPVFPSQSRATPLRYPDCSRALQFTWMRVQVGNGQGKELVIDLVSSVRSFFTILYKPFDVSINAHFFIYCFVAFSLVCFHFRYTGAEWKTV
jgi:accessory gene regulator protein AgrB